MKRSTIPAAALCLCLLLLGGCAAPQEPAPQPQPPQTEQIEPPAPAPQPAPAQGEQMVAEPVPAAPQPVHHIPTGVWLARTDVGYSNYYYFNSEEQNGRYASLDYGLGMSFNYEGAGDELVFLMGDDAEAHTARIEHAEGDRFTLLWENNLSEHMEFVCEGSLDEFRFYSNDELIRMSAAYFARKGEAVPSMSAAITNADNTVTVQLYDNLGDHNSTSAWYVLDRFTATGTDLFTGMEIDLRAPIVPNEEDIGDSELPAEDDVPVTEEVRYDVSEADKVAALIDLFLNDPETVENHGGERLVDWLTNSTHGFTVLYGDPYFSFQGEWTVGWYAKAVDAGSFCPITISEHLLDDVLAICETTI